jgi:hypothetical protein
VTGGRTFAYLVLAVISVLVAAIAARTVLAISQGRLLPPTTAPIAAPLLAPATDTPEVAVAVAAS